MFIIAPPAWCYTVSGVVKDNTETLIGASVREIATQRGVATDENGRFQLEVTDENSKLQISYVGYKSKTITAKDIKQNNPIVLTEDTEKLNSIIVNDVKIGRNCTEQELKNQDQNAIAGTVSRYNKEKDTVTCKITKCIDRYEPTLDGKNCEFVIGSKCTDQELKKQDPNAIAGIVLDYKDGIKCQITKCNSGYTPSGDALKCLSTKCDCLQEWDDTTKKCKNKDTNCTADNAAAAHLECQGGKEVCIITACVDEYRLENNACIYNRGEACVSDDPNATSATLHRVNGKLVCQPDSCNTGFDLKGGKCVAREIASDEEIAALEQNAQQMEDKKNSLANRAIGAAGIGATGIGGMMALSALSEQKSDDAAERDMRAYLATFRCDYGTGGNSVTGGTANVELPGGNDMINLYTQYATLANDLKIRKDALGIKPGIESEVVIDKAETGLYDDVGTGITGGAYASIARALRDPNGEDAKIWNEQKKKTSSNLKTGAIVAGVGAAGSLAANLAVNSGSDKQDKTDKILDEYKSKRTTVDSNTPNAKTGQKKENEKLKDLKTNITGKAVAESSQNIEIPTPTVTSNVDSNTPNAKTGQKKENEKLKDLKTDITGKAVVGTSGTEISDKKDTDDVSSEQQNTAQNKDDPKYFVSNKVDKNELKNNAKSYIHNELGVDISEEASTKMATFITKSEQKFGPDNVYLDEFVKSKLDIPLVIGIVAQYPGSDETTVKNFCNELNRSICTNGLPFNSDKEHNCYVLPNSTQYESVSIHGCSFDITKKITITEKNQNTNTDNGKGTSKDDVQIQEEPVAQPKNEVSKDVVNENINNAKKYPSDKVNYWSNRDARLIAPNTDYTALSTDTKRYINDILDSNITDEDANIIRSFIRTFSSNDADVFFEQMEKEKQGSIISVYLIDKKTNFNQQTFKQYRQSGKDVPQEKQMEQKCKNYNKQLCKNNNCEIIYYGTNHNSLDDLDTTLRYFGCKIQINK